MSVQLAKPPLEARSVYAEHGIEIVHGDAWDVVPQCQGGFAACITDPPYGQTSLQWDKWVEGWPALLIGQTTTLWSCGSFAMFMEHAREFFECGWKVAQDLVWEKHNGSGSASDRFRRVHEHAVHFYRGPWAEQVKQPPKRMDATARTVRRKGRVTHWGDIDGHDFQSHDGGPRLQRSVLRYKSEHGHALHPTQKPVALMRMLIEFSTKPGDIILDPFCGAGSTLVAAKQLGRRAIGIECNLEHCMNAAARLSQELPLAQPDVATAPWTLPENKR